MYLICISYVSHNLVSYLTYPSMTRPSTRQLRFSDFSLQFLPTQTSAPSPSPCVFFQYQILTVLLFEFTLHTFTSPLSHHHSRATPAFNPDGNPTAPEPRIPSIQLHPALFRDQRYTYSPQQIMGRMQIRKNGFIIFFPSCRLFPPIAHCLGIGSFHGTTAV